MPQNPQAVLKDLKAKKYAPVYFLDGEESFFIDQISDYIEVNAIAEHEKSFNQVVMYGKESTIGSILNNARKFPMMADRQVVIVKEAQSIPDLNKEEPQKLLIGYLQNPLPSTILVFAHKYKKVDGRQALGKMLDKKTVYVRSEKIKEHLLNGWIEDYIKLKGHKIDGRGAQLLADSIGNNLEVLTNEIGKMLINFQQPTNITIDHISKYVGINKEYNNFEFTKAIGFRQIDKANKIVHYFIQNPKANPVIPMFSLMYSYFTKIAMIHQARNGGAADSQLAGLLGIHPYGVKEYAVAANNYKLGKVIEVFGFIKEADLRFKGVDSGSLSEAENLRELVYKILH
jgi:DNA polymerase-3 subunit delta